VNTTGSTTVSSVGPVILQLSSTPSNITGAEAAIVAAIIAVVDIDPSRIDVIIDPTTNTVTILVDGNTTPGSPTTAPTVIPPSGIINITSISVSTSEGNIYLEAGQCLAYTFEIGSNVATVYVYAAIQTQNAGQGLTVLLKNGYVPSATDYDCTSPLIQDNNEYQFSWQSTSGTTVDETGTFYGASSSIQKANTCLDSPQLMGNWFALICASGADLQFSFEVDLVPLSASTPTSPSADGDDLNAARVKFGSITVLLMGLILLSIFN